MTGPWIVSRRSLLVGFWLAGTSLVAAQVPQRGNDHGIGGTGITGGSDQGIGGTGIVGVIQRFGSIFVNGERIAYGANVQVRIDGELTSAKSLRIGHVARVVARRDVSGKLSTGRIDAVSEVIGPVEHVKAGEMVVLGQKVLWTGREGWLKPGAHVAVFGLRRNDGAIVASLVQNRHGNLMRVVGLLEHGGNGMFRIGGLTVTGVNPALAGQRVEVEGRVAANVMQVARSRVDDFSDLAGATRLSIEAYVQKIGSDLHLGSGFVARDTSRFATAPDTRVIVNATLDGPRTLRVESVQSVNKFPGSSMQKSGTPTRQPGGEPGHGGRSNVPGGGVPNESGSHGNGPGGDFGERGPSGPDDFRSPGGGGPFGPGGGGPFGPGGGFGGGGPSGGGGRR